MRQPITSTALTFLRAHNKNFLKTFVFTSIALMLITGSIFYAIYNISKTDRDQQMVNNEDLMVQLHYETIITAMEEATNTLIYFSNLQALSDYINNPTVINKHQLEATIESYPIREVAYDQVRLLDTTGMEILRVNNNGLRGSVVPEAQLQDKSDRYYFMDLQNTPTDQIYFSRLDLNVENGEIELPYKPTVRIGMDVHNAAGEIAGYLLINIDFNQVMDKFVLDEETNEIIGSILLVDQNGYYVFNEPYPYKQYGAILLDRSQFTFQADEPSTWEGIVRQENGILRNKNGLFTFTKVDLMTEDSRSRFLDERFSINSPDSVYYLIFHLQPWKIDILEKNLRTLRNVFLLVYLIVLPIMTYVSSILVSLLNENRLAYIYQSQHDPLTGIGNRKLLFAKFDEDAMSKKDPRGFSAVFYFDLDGFKQVNDQFGHNAGDVLLEQVTKKVSGVLRKSDTLARMGGDEFAIVTKEPMDRSSAGALGQRVVDVIREPVMWEGNQLRVSASVGIYLCGEGKVDINQAILRADNAMYMSKQSGKDRFQFSDEV